ncbi:hypothetical protein PJE062_3018 [Pseudovibrio sp. JE062]|nr:hypothetical protein PJE062_3018 [Pseudovibrio sp. JE062]
MLWQNAKAKQAGPKERGRPLVKQNRTGDDKSKRCDVRIYSCRGIKSFEDLQPRTLIPLRI